MSETENFTEFKHQTSPDRNFKIYSTRDKKHNLDLIIVMVGKGYAYCGGLVVVDDKGNIKTGDHISVPADTSV